MERLKPGDVYFNTFFGDLWTVCENESLVRINTGETIYLENLHNFLKIGKIDEVTSLDTSFYHELNNCPLCDSNKISCTLDMSNWKWKIGCETPTCPCCIDHMIGKYITKSEAIKHWNKD